MGVINKGIREKKGSLNQRSLGFEAKKGKVKKLVNTPCNFQSLDHTCDLWQSRFGPILYHAVALSFFIRFKNDFHHYKEQKTYF